MRLSARLIGFGAGMAFAVLLSGCATSKNNPNDPLEGFNRAMFSFNEKVDQVALRPASTVYKTLLPSFVQTGIGNFFGNLGDVWTAVNNLLQGKVEDGMSDVARVMINTFAGIGGLIDVASDANLPKHHEDFGQTLGKWGVGSGPYVVLPILGPSTLRDTVALPVDWTGDPWIYTTPVRVRNTGIVVRAVDQRASVLDATKLIDEVAIDKYEFMRDAYLQRRLSQVLEDKNQPDDLNKGGNAKEESASGDWQDVDDSSAKPPEKQPEDKPASVDSAAGDWVTVDDSNAKPSENQPAVGKVSAAPSATPGTAVPPKDANSKTAPSTGTQPGQPTPR